MNLREGILLPFPSQGQRRRNRAASGFQTLYNNDNNSTSTYVPGATLSGFSDLYV